jgi:hypothetical protein
LANLAEKQGERASGHFTGSGLDPNQARHVGARRSQ